MRCLLVLLAAFCLPGCLSTWSWPDTARPADGLAIRYEEHGGGEPALVFLHAWSCDRQFWTHQVRPFARARHVLAVDLAGHGQSEAAREPRTIAQLGQDVATVCADAGVERVVFIGHSLGAAVALEAARILGERCVAIVAVDALHDVEHRASDAEIEALLAPRRADFARVTGDWVRAQAFAPSADPALVDLVATRISARPPAVALPLLDALMRYDAASALERVTCPVHCIQGAGRETNVAAARRHHARFDAENLAGVGHFGMLEDPAGFNRVLGAYLYALANPP